MTALACVATCCANVHDPAGELDLVHGVYLGTDGKFQLYSASNLGRRWMAEGVGTGWGFIARRKRARAVAPAGPRRDTDVTS